MARLWRKLNSKRYCIRSPLEFRTIFARVFQRYQPVSLKSLQNPIYIFLESYIYFGILHLFWNPKQNGNGIPATNFGIPFFFRMESHGIRRFFSLESHGIRRFFLESQGIYTSLVPSSFQIVLLRSITIFGVCKLLQLNKRR